MASLLTPDWGRFLLSLALVCSVVQILAGARGGAANFAIARRAAMVGGLALIVSLLVLIGAFWVTDYSVGLVYTNSHLDKPAIYKVAAAWGNHEGSMLLWCAVLAGIAALFGWRQGAATVLSERTLSVLGMLSLAFIAFTLFTSNPFERLTDPPLIGRGFNPLLQDPAVALHPPLLYLGYVGLAAPFALSVAALWTGDVDANWARSMRRWSLFAFVFLTFGIGLGSYWAYYELGWGGWWFWDPVENASLMPWLLAAAILHSALVAERRRLLFGWTALLGVLGFCYAVLGTFLTRSGVVTSVHTFANDPERGVFLLLILGVCVVLPLVLFAMRSHKLARAEAAPSMTSREGLLVANNLFLVVATGIVMAGTLLPILAAALGQALSVGPPYYEKAVLPVMGIAFLLTPIATLTPWGARQFGVQRRAVAGLTLGLGLTVLAALAIGASLGAAITAGVGVWLLVGAGLDAAGRLAVERRGAGEAWRFVRKRPSVLASAFAHAGIGILALGAAAGVAFSDERSVLLRAGDARDVGPAAVELRSVGFIEGPNYIAQVADVVVDAGGQGGLSYAPELRRYAARAQTTREVDIRSGIGGDHYVSFGLPNEARSGPNVWQVTWKFNAMIWMVFAGMTLIGVGAGLALLGSVQRRDSA